MELRQPLAIGLLDLGHVLHDLQREAEKLAAGAAEDLLLDLRLHLLFRAGDLVPGLSVGLFPFGIGCHLLPEIVFLGLFLGQNGRVGQRHGAPLIDLQAVLQEEDRAADQPRLLRTLRSEGLGRVDAARQQTRSWRDRVRRAPPATAPWCPGVPSCRDGRR